MNKHTCRNSLLLLALLGAVLPFTAAQSVRAATVPSTASSERSAAQPGSELVAGDPMAYDSLGSAVAISGNTAVIGAPTSASDVAAPGCAYVFVRSGDTWRRQARLTASPPVARDGFGSAVAIYGRTIVVASTEVTPTSTTGCAYVFVRSGHTWRQQALLTSGDTTDDSTYGTSVALFGDELIVGDIGTTVDGNVSAGCAYVFARSGDTWTQRGELTAGDPSAFALFGSAAAISNDTVLIGADLDGGLYSGNGAAYVFGRSAQGWHQQAKLTAGDLAGQAYFGCAVALAGDTALIGAQHDTTQAGLQAGAAYLFKRSAGGWEEHAKLTPSDAAAGDFFGCAVSLAHGRALIGARFATTAAGPSAGSAYLFASRSGTWTQRYTVAPSDAAAGYHFGFSLALGGRTALIGAPGATVAGQTQAGTAYTFLLARTPWTKARVFPKARATRR
jgi:hypothetical protein